jgi:hypothetical protein
VEIKDVCFSVIKLYQTVYINWKDLLYTQQYVTHEDKIQWTVTPVNQAFCISIVGSTSNGSKIQ